GGRAYGLVHSAIILVYGGRRCAARRARRKNGRRGGGAALGRRATADPSFYPAGASLYPLAAGRAPALRLARDLAQPVSHIHGDRPGGGAGVESACAQHRHSTKHRASGRAVWHRLVAVARSRQRAGAAAPRTDGWLLAAG